MNKKMLVTLVVVSLGAFQAARADLAGLGKKFGGLYGEAKKIAKEAAPIAAPAQVYDKNTEISFEVKNKDKKPVYFKVQSGEELYEEAGKNLFSAEPGKTTQLKPSIKEETTVSVWTSKPTADQNPDQTYTISAGKTLYLTWDGAQLRPQTGPAQGLLGKTDTGLSLKEPGNVLPGNIQRS